MTFLPNFESLQFTVCNSAHDQFNEITSVVDNSHDDNVNDGMKKKKNKENR